MGERYNAYKPVISRLTTWNNLNHSTNDSGISSNSSDFTYYSGSNTTKTPQMGKRHDIGRYVMKYQLNNPLTALSSSPDQTRVIVAGSSVLKILNVSDKEITEESNLNVRHGNRNSNITDVKWGNSCKLRFSPKELKHTVNPILFFISVYITFHSMQEL